MSKKQIVKQAHKLAKKLVEKVGNYMIALKLAYNIGVERETEKALLLCFETDFGNITMWAPKSVVKGF